jgi:hypothetical protein
MPQLTFPARRDRRGASAEALRQPVLATAGANWFNGAIVL